MGSHGAMYHGLLTPLYQIKRFSDTWSKPEIGVREMVDIQAEGTVQRSLGKQACSKN